MRPTHIAAALDHLRDPEIALDLRHIGIALRDSRLLYPNRNSLRRISHKSDTCQSCFCRSGHDLCNQFVMRHTIRADM